MKKEVKLPGLNASLQNGNEWVFLTKSDSDQCISAGKGNTSQSKEEVLELEEQITAGAIG